MSKFDASIKQLYSKDNSKFTYYTATERITIYAGQDGVTEEWIQRIKELHRIERNSARHDEGMVNLDAISAIVGDKSEFLTDSVKSPEMILIEEESKYELQKCLKEALETLNENQRDLLMKVRVENKSISSVAQGESLHESSVRERLHPIEKKLRRNFMELLKND